jgi:hypothetical protein
LRRVLGVRSAFASEAMFYLAFVCFVIDALLRWWRPRFNVPSAATFTVCGLALVSLGLLLM